jgi:hypothetical protein
MELAGFLAPLAVCGQKHGSFHPFQLFSSDADPTGIHSAL